MAKLLLARDESFYWVCDNPKKIGEKVYGITMEHQDAIPGFNNPQIMIVVTSPDDKTNIRKILKTWNKKPVADFWFFV